MDRHPSVFAALVAALLLSFLPACGVTPRPAPVLDGAIENPHIVQRVAPRDPDIPTGIQRSAGSDEGAFLAFYYLFYIFFWFLVELIDVINESNGGHPYYDDECDD